MSLFNPSRDEVRAFFFGVWAKFKASQPLSEIEKIGLSVIHMHPEYHAILDAPERFKHQAYYPEAGETNPFLHMSLHLSILEQISINQPIGIKNIYEQLILKYRNQDNPQHDAQHDILDCLAETLWQAQRNQLDLNSDDYIKLLQQKVDERI